MTTELDAVQHLRMFADQRKLHLYRSDVDEIADEFETTRGALAEERALADRLAMLLVNSQACDAPLWWVMERTDLLAEWTTRRQP